MVLVAGSKGGARQITSLPPPARSFLCCWEASASRPLPRLVCDVAASRGGGKPGAYAAAAGGGMAPADSSASCTISGWRWPLHSSRRQSGVVSLVGESVLQQGRLAACTGESGSTRASPACPHVHPAQPRLLPPSPART